MNKKDKFAIIKLAGTQHLVRVGDTLEINRLDQEENKSFDIDEVLLIQDGEKINIGTPLIEKAKVTAKVLEHLKGEKLHIQKFRAKSRSRKKIGHRQYLTKIEIIKIS